jgi:hypothetical protein
MFSDCTILTSGSTRLAAALGATLLVAVGCNGAQNGGKLGGSTGSRATSSNAGGNSGNTGPNGAGGRNTTGATSATATSATGTSTATSATGTSISSSNTTGGSTSFDAGIFSLDPLLTNLPPLFNGNSVDMYDCPILALTAKYNEPDAMIFKAIIYVESRFQYDAVGCTGNSGCCPKSDWTGEECDCLGPMQSGPTCGSSSTLGLLANGHPDLDTDPNSPAWANSCFNPWVAIELGIAGIAYNRALAEQQFPGCTVDQYTLMAIGNFNDYGSTQSCTVYNTTYDSSVLAAYHQYSIASGWPAHAY